MKPRLQNAIGHVAKCKCVVCRNSPWLTDRKGNDLNDGVWFQADCSGLWYRNHNAAGAIRTVRVDGVEFKTKPRIA